MISQLDESNFTETLEATDKTVLVDFFADWCGPCKMMAPVVDELSNELKDVEFYKVNVDECSDIAKKYGIMSIPTFIAFKSGQPVNKALGAMAKTELEMLVK